jgi:hypothetical protein
LILAIDSSIINVPVVNKFLNIQMVSMEPELAPYGMVKLVKIMVVMTIVSSSLVLMNFVVAKALGMTRMMSGMMMLMMVHKLWIMMVVWNNTLMLVWHKNSMVVVVWNIEALVLVVFVAGAVGRTAVITMMRTASSNGSLGQPHLNLLQPGVTIIFIAHSRKHDTDGNKHDEDDNVSFHFKVMYTLKKAQFFK